MRMKKLFSFYLIALLFLSSQAYSQQHYQLSQFFQNMQAFNPAFSGVNNWIDIKTSYRHQWSGFEGAPETFMISVQTPTNLISQRLYKKYSFRVSNPEIYQELKDQALNQIPKVRHGVGLYLINDRQELYSNTSLFGSYSLQYLISSNLYLAAGVSASVNHFDKNEDKITVRNPENDLVFQHFMNGGDDLNDVRMSAGILLYGKNFYAGYSSVQFISRSPFEQENDDNEIPNDHHYLMGAYNFNLNDDFSVTPVVLLKYSLNSPFYYYSLVKASYMEKIWAGIGYRADNALINMIGFSVNNKFHISYSYDHNFSTLSQYSNGSHEIVLGLTLNRHYNGFQIW